MEDRLTHLRALAGYHAGTDLPERLAHAERIIADQRDGLAWAVDEIDRLRAKLQAHGIEHLG